MLDRIGPVHIDPRGIGAAAFPQVQFAAGPVQDLFHGVGNTVDLIGPDHKIQMWDRLEQFFAPALCHTAHQAEDHVLPLGFDPLHDPQFADGFPFCLIPHAAGVQDHDIGFIFIFGWHIAVCDEQGGCGIRIPFVHLASVCFDMKLECHQRTTRLLR